MNATKQAVLAQYGLTPADLLGSGMEAEVYRYGADAVLKLYPRGISIDNLRRLQTFYASLDRAAISYALPAIDRIVDEGDYVVTVEPRLLGRPLTTLIAVADHDQLGALFPSYVAAVLELARIAMPPATTHYKLYDPDALSVRAEGDWHHFLRRWLGVKLRTLSACFERDVEQFCAKQHIMDAVLAQPYEGEYRLIHGDLCPENVLVDEHGQALALLDFGLFTMYGDPLFDAATAWGFFDMYDERQANVRARLLPLFLDRLGAGARGKLYRYILLYSLLSANTYSPDCSDGHYGWCVANLNTDTYWNRIE